MFSKDEAQALVAAVRVAEARLDAGLATQAENALSKILAVLPLDARAAAESLALFAPMQGLDPKTSAHLEALRTATESRRKLRLHYLDLGGIATERVVRPLACLFWGPTWTVAAWCELREDFRTFRVDRIESIDALDERFRDEPGKTLADMNRQREGAA
jgi:predicted DNA-binding transcriptional regulator YafY